MGGSWGRAMHATLSAEKFHDEIPSPDHGVTRPRKQRPCSGRGRGDADQTIRDPFAAVYIHTVLAVLYFAKLC
jgi:hypothetical protein